MSNVNYCLVIRDCNGEYYREFEIYKPTLDIILNYERYYSTFKKGFSDLHQDAVVVNVYEIKE